MLSKLILNKTWGAGILALVGALSGCSGSSVSGDGPELQIPDSIEWQENKAFSYPLATAGTAPFTFHLVSTPDAAMFTVDPVSGQLTANHLFDYESPRDSDADGIYQLTVNVIDGDSRADTKTFFIEISNVSEFETEVTFPIEHSNAGGVASAMHIRGYLTKDGQRVESQPESIKVLVAGVEAIFEADDSSAWVAEVPLEMGLNNLAIEVAGDVNVESQATFALDNSPIRRPSGVGSIRNSSYANGYLYSIDVGAQTVMRTSELNHVTERLFSAGDILGVDCAEISGIKATTSGSTLVFSCYGVQQNGSAILAYDLESQNFSFVTERFYGQFDIAADKYIVVRSNEESFEVFGLSGISLAQVQLETIAPELELVDLYFASATDGMIYFMVSDSLNYGMAFVHVEQLLTAEFGLVLDESASFDFTFSGPSSVLGTYLAPHSTRFYLSNGDVYRYSGNGGSSVAEVVVQNAVSEIFSSTNGGIIIHADDQMIVVEDAYEQEVYRFDLDTSARAVVLPQDPSSGFRGDLFLNSDNSKMVTFDWRSLSYRKLDVATLKLEESKSLVQVASDFSPAFSYTNYNWDENVIYISKILGWGGVPEDDQAHLVALDIQNETLTPLITGLDLAAYFNDPLITRYRLGTPSYNPIANEVWFSMMAGFEDAGGFEGVYRYDLQQQAFSAVSEVAVPLEVRPDTDYVSAYDETSGQVALAGWNRGYIKLLQDNGSIRTVNVGRNPYLTTIDPEIDSANNRVFATGFYPQEDDPEFADLSFSELAAFDMRTGNISVVASNERGHGLPLNWPQKRYDENNNRLYSIYGGYLMLIDPDYGDRVILPIN